MAIFSDDMLNGNVTIDRQNFFMGLNIMNERISNLGGNITQINLGLQNLTTNSLNPTLTTILTQAATTKTKIS